MEHLFQVSRPETIFHAAAYKHVPLMEENVSAALQNNIFGLMSLMEMASEYECPLLQIARQRVHLASNAPFHNPPAFLTIPQPAGVPPALSAGFPFIQP